MISVSLISIVDDDESVRESLERLPKSVGFRVEAFALGDSPICDPYKRRFAELIAFFQSTEANVTTV